MTLDFLTDIFRNFPDAIIIVNRNGFVEYVNKRMLELFSYPDENEVRGKKIWELSAVRQLDATFENAENAALRMIEVTALKGSHSFEWKHQKKNGEDFFTEINLQYIPNEEEELFVSSIRDISRRKKLEKELISMTRKADESSQQKLEFLSNMSHEIRSPLNVIIGFTELLELTDINENEYKEYAEVIRANSNMLLRLIEDIIDVSKIETNKLRISNTDFRVNELMEEIFQSLSLNNTSEGVKMQLNIPSGHNAFTFHSDPYRLKQILTNLITNAQKFTEKGFVEIGYTFPDTATIEFFVKDSGKGISDEELQNIFKRFEQGANIDLSAIKGFGLGLAISKGLSKMMGGQISVQSELGKGSCFTVRFPLSEKQGSKAEKNGHNQYPDLTGVRILIAEDVYENFEFLKAVLKRTNASITRANDGQEAVEYIRNNPYDLVLMDIKMPEMDGYQALQKIRSTHTSLPIIAQTAYALKHDENRGLEAGFNDYISKPISIDLLFKKICTLLNFKEVNKQ